jgi:hypothetical protein
MQNHMSDLIAKQNGEKTNDYVESGKNNKKDSEKKTKFSRFRRLCTFFKLIRRQKRDPTERPKETKIMQHVKQRQ